MTVARVPETVDDISTDWLNEFVFPDARENPITGIKKTVIGDGRGFMSLVVQVEIECAGTNATLPSSVVVKMRPYDEATRKAEKLLHGFVREMEFYKKIAPASSGGFPKVYFSEIDGEASALVMEDLSHYQPCDQIKGITNAQAYQVLDSISPIHARYWNSPKLSEMHWAPSKDHFFIDHVREGWPAFADRYRSLLGSKGVEIGEFFVNNIGRIERAISERPRTIVHGDLRADNLLYDPNAEKIIVLDWQCILRSMGAIDIARLYGGSESILERGHRHREYIERWHSTLQSNGVSDYTFDEAWHDFRLATFHILSVPMKVHMLFEPSTGRRAELHTTRTERMFELATSIDVLNVFEGP